MSPRACDAVLLTGIVGAVAVLVFVAIVRMSAPATVGPTAAAASRRTIAIGGLGRWESRGIGDRASLLR